MKIVYKYTYDSSKKDTSKYDVSVDWCNTIDFITHMVEWMFNAAEKMWQSLNLSDEWIGVMHKCFIISYQSLIDAKNNIPLKDTIKKE